MLELRFGYKPNLPWEEKIGDWNPLPQQRREYNTISKKWVRITGFVKFNLIRHKLTVCATKKRHLQLEMV